MTDQTDKPSAGVMEACRKAVKYRDSVTAMQFQLEKADDFYYLMRVALDEYDAPPREAPGLREALEWYKTRVYWFAETKDRASRAERDFIDDAGSLGDKALSAHPVEEEKAVIQCVSCMCKGCDGTQTVLAEKGTCPDYVPVEEAPPAGGVGVVDALEIALRQWKHGYRVLNPDDHPLVEERHFEGQEYRRCEAALAVHTGKGEKGEG